MNPVFLSLDDVIAIHKDQIERYGGDLGLRDLGLLESAIAVPEAGFGGTYFHGDIFEMAAAYLFHIVKNHPFVDGNKRAGAMAAYVFLRINGFDVESASEGAFEKLVLSVAQGKSEKSAVAGFFRKRASRA